MERPVNTTIPAQIKFLLFQAKKSVLCLVSILELPTWGGCIRPLGRPCFSSSSSLRSSSTKRFHETSPQSFPVCQNIIRGYCGTLQYGYFRKVRWICVFHKNILEKCVPKIGLCTTYYVGFPRISTAFSSPLVNERVWERSIRDSLCKNCELGKPLSSKHENHAENHITARAHWLDWILIGRLI